MAFECSGKDTTELFFLQSLLAGCIFMTLTVILTYYGYRLYTIASTTGSTLMRVRHKQQSTRQIVVITTVIVLVFVTRSIHDFLSTSKKYRSLYGRNPLHLFLACRVAVYGFDVSDRMRIGFLLARTEHCGRC